MGGINLSVHPLFYPFGFYYALTGRIFEFVIYTVTAVVHELGHSFVAARAGYRLYKITLMPFGAVASGNIDGLKVADEIKIALAGPFINLATGIFFVALWWILPESYAFTDVVAEANFSMALINLLPVFPLDGGRVLSACLTERLGAKRAFTVCKVSGGIFAAALLAGFVATAFYKVNFSLLFFSLFALFGAFGRGKDNKYVKLYTALSAEKLKRGVPYKKQAVDKSVTVKKVMSLLDEASLNEIVVFDGDKPRAVLSQNRLNEILEKADLYAPIEKYL